MQNNFVESIEVNVIAHSISKKGKEILTYELVYPRAVHSELAVHRMLSKNSASSRAIPIPRVIEMVRNNPAMLSRYGSNQAGMQDKGFEHDEPVVFQGKSYTIREAWKLGAEFMCDLAESIHEAGYHKQVGNRLLEPFQWMKVVLTGTEFANFFWLRDHEAADPTIAELARKMLEAKQRSSPVLLGDDDWHVPYFENGYWIAERVGMAGLTVNSSGITLQEALDISTSCCAQVSYRKLDKSQEKADTVISRLNLDGKHPEDPAHASPTEHQATPMTGDTMIFNGFPTGYTSYHKDLGMMSGNLAGWIQYRQLIPNTTKW